MPAVTATFPSPTRREDGARPRRLNLLRHLRRGIARAGPDVSPTLPPSSAVDEALQTTLSSRPAAAVRGRR